MSGIVGNHQSQKAGMKPVSRRKFFNSEAARFRLLNRKRPHFDNLQPQPVFRMQLILLQQLDNLGGVIGPIRVLPLQIRGFVQTDVKIFSYFP